MTIDEFLLARYDELESKASDVHGVDCSAFSADAYGPEYIPTDCDCGVPTQLRTDLADKRKIIEDYREAQANPRPFNSVIARAAALTWVMRYLAQPFAAHPDFSPEWKTP
jgi:hypothetical protein